MDDIKEYIQQLNMAVFKKSEIFIGENIDALNGF